MIASFSAVCKSFGSQDVLDNVTQRIHENSRIGLVGENGAGKTTLLKMLTGEVTPDSGQVWVKDPSSVGYLSQDLELDPSRSVLDNALDVFSDLARLEARIESTRQEISATEDPERLERLNRIFSADLEAFAEGRGLYFRGWTASCLTGLGFSAEELERRAGELSGGQRMRLALARLLLKSPDLLLLDEPTNYLDLSSAAWLESFLASYPHAYVAVSHDRYFLEKTASSIWLVQGGAVSAWKGNYSAYAAQREAAESAAAKAYATAKKEEARQLEVIRRLKSYNREKSVRQAESREKALERMKIPEKPKASRTARFGFDAGRTVTRNVLTMKGLFVGYAGKAVAGGFDARITAGDKIGLCADNASGKSTLLKTLMGDIPPVSGSFEFGAGVKPVIFRQEREEASGARTLLEEVSASSAKGAAEIRAVLGALLFGEDAVHKPLASLSGGERSRVEVAKLMLCNANFLMLDEPTSHLDIASCEVFEEAMRGYSGTLILVSHDRYLLSRVAGKMFFIDSGSVSFYEEPYEKAQELRRAAAAPQEAASPAAPREAAEPARGRERGRLSKNRRSRLEMRVAQIESELGTLRENIRAAESRMSDPRFYARAQETASELAGYGECLARAAALEDEWVAAVELLEEDDEAAGNG